MKKAPVAKRRRALSLSKNLFFDRLAEVKEAPKTSNPGASAYIGTVETGLRSKAKWLAKANIAAAFDRRAMPAPTPTVL